MEIKASLVKELRDRTGAGMMDCKKALSETDGELDKAVDALRKKGIAKAEKLAGRRASEGLVDAYIHLGGKIGVLIEVNCETDFVARTEDFRTLIRDLAMQVAAADPKAVRREEVDPKIAEHENEIYRAQTIESGKPETVLEKIVIGKMEKFYHENCLVEQPFIKDPDMTVQQHIDNYRAKLGENIIVNRFTRFHLGEE